MHPGSPLETAETIMKQVLVDEVASAPPGAGAVGPPPRVAGAAGPPPRVAEAVGELAGAAKEGPLARSVGVAQRPTGAVSDEVIERAHHRQMLHAGFDSHRAAIVAAAGYSVSLERIERLIRSPLGARDVALPGRW